MVGYIVYRLASPSGSSSYLDLTEVAAQVGSPPEFEIGGSIAEAFYPGVSHPLDLVFTNPGPVAITVTSVTITVDVATSNAGCTGTDNLTIEELGTPVTVPARSTRSLSELRVPRSVWPVLTMPARPASQDACQGAVLTLRYTGEASYP
jgi:hypothetical protein